MNLKHVVLTVVIVLATMWLVNRVPFLSKITA